MTHLFYVEARSQQVKKTSRSVGILYANKSNGSASTNEQS